MTSAAGLAMDRMAAVGAGLPPLLHSRVSVLCAFVLRCFSVLTLYSPPRSIVWGLFFPSLFPLVYAVNFLNKPLHFTADCTWYDCVCDK